MQPSDGEEKSLQMGWYKFLIYFLLYAGAVMNFWDGWGLVTGSVYGDAADEVYAVFSAMKTVDLPVGILLIALAVLNLVTRARLAAFRRNGPKLLCLCYLGSALINTGYQVSLYVVLPSAVGIGSILGVALSLTVALINYLYFKKRAGLFVN